MRTETIKHPARRNSRYGRFIPGSISAALLLQALALLPIAANAADNVRLHGALVADPCFIPPGKENIALDFNTVVDKYLYLNTRTLGHAFSIPLTGCDLSLGKTVKVTFKGTENAALPGLLAVDGVKGIAIGLETMAGTPLPLDKQSASYALFAGDMEIPLKAYVQGEPEAIANKTIERGAFTSVTTFVLDYE